MGEAGPSSSGRIAYLGPEGTYGQQATRAFSDLYLKQDKLEAIACPTISDAYEEEAEYTVLPLENTIYGPVTETLDCFFARFSPTTTTSTSLESTEGLRSLNGGRANGNGNGKGKGKGKEKEIIATLDLPIRHCLVVTKGTKMEDIKIVSSHEQALGQSSTFLNTHLPNTKRISTASTALAAESLLGPISFRDSDRAASEAEGVIGRAAICSSSVVGIYPELEVLYEGTQDRSDNFTRFILLQTKSIEATSSEPNTTPKSRSISNFYLLDSPSRIPNLLSGTKTSTVGSLHSRPTPSMDGRVYPHGMFIELISDGYVSREIGDGDGVLYLGSGSVVKLDI